MPQRSFTLRQGVGFSGGTDGSQIRTSPQADDALLRSDNFVVIGAAPEAGFTAAPLTYTSVDLSWSIESSVTWLEIIVVASTTGHPVTPLDGRTVTVVDASSPVYNVVDINLTPGTWYYYALFVKIDDTVNEHYQRLKIADALLPGQFGNTERLYNRLPEYYRLADAELGADSPLLRYVGLIGYEVDYMQTLINTVRDLRKLQTIPVTALPLVGHMLGIGAEADGISESRYRYLCQNIMHLRLNKGTPAGIRGYISALSGYPADIEMVNDTRYDIEIYAQRVNLLKNPKFNTLGEWTVVNGGATVGAAANVVTITNGTGSTVSVTLTSNSFPVLAGRRYGVGLLVNEIAASATLVTSVRWNGTTDQPLGYLQPLVVGTTAPQRLVTEALEAPGGTTTGTVRFTLSVPAGGVVKLTRAICEPGVVGEYFDGDTQSGGYLPGSTGQFDFRWDTTIDASYSYYNLDYGRMQKIVLNALPSILPVGITVGGSSGYAITEWSKFPGK